MSTDLPEPIIVGTKANIIGSMRSPWRRVYEWNSLKLKQKKKLTFLSEYHPQKSVISAATAPPGVERIRVCLDLIKKRYGVDESRYLREHIRISKIPNNQITDWNKTSFRICGRIDMKYLQLLRPPLGMLAALDEYDMEGTSANPLNWVMSLEQSTKFWYRWQLQQLDPSWYVCSPSHQSRLALSQEQQFALPLWENARGLVNPATI